MKKKILIAIVAILVIIQFFPTDKNQSTEVLATDFIKQFNPPTAIASKLKASCYDCHSNNTAYPWYNKIQPVAWFLENHIKEAKEELNFSEFGSYSAKKQKHKIEEMIDEIEENEMPLTSYTLIHGDAKFSDEERKTMLVWLEKLK